MNRYRSAFAVFLAVLFSSAITPQLAKADTIHVPLDMPTIQGAIDLAVDGDTVLVAPGTYFENIDYLGKAITVTSEAGPENTIIDGGSLDSVIRIVSGEGTDAILNGFTVQNGALFNASDGGGILISESSPTISGNWIINNTACSGLGIAVDFGSPVIRGNVIRDNTQNGCSGAVGGGGISVGGTSTTQILDNIISDNVVSQGYGGGILLNSAGTTVIQGNIIRDNTGGISGGAISITNFSNVRIIENLIVGNTAGTGAAVRWLGFGPVMISNTIADNIANASTGSTILSDGASDLTLLINNQIIAHPGQNAIECSAFRTTQPIMAFNNVFSAGGLAYEGTCTNQTGIDGNITEEPDFVDPGSGDYRLGPNSASLDAGDDAAPDLPVADFDGNPRFFDGDNDGFATVDIGAFEFQDQPVANAGFDQTVRDFETFALDGSGSFDPLGGSLTYLWTLDGVELDTAATTVVGPFAVGSYTFTLTVADFDGNTSSDAMVVIVLPPNEPPIANAGADRTATRIDSILLDGSASFDPDGTDLTYVWGLGGTDIAVGPNPTVGPFELGTHEITLTVTDIDGASASDTVTVSVINNPPVAWAGLDQSIRVTQTATLDGRAAFDWEGGPLTYEWSQDGVPFSPEPTVIVGPFDVGTYTFVLTVTDDQGASNSDAMVLTVLPPNEPPVANAGPDETVTDLDFVRLSGTLSFDPDGTFLSYVWTLDGNQIATGSAPYVGSFAVGTYTFELTVTDADGATDSDSMILTVETPLNLAPIAVITTDQFITDRDPVVLDGTASYDPEGGPLTYRWSLPGGEVRTDAVVTLNPLPVGEHVVILQVTDQEGESSSSGVRIYVSSGNHAPVANAGPDQMITVLATASLDATGSSDPNGDPLTYVWSENGTQIATGATPLVGPFDEGFHTITLTVMDPEGAMASDNLVLTVTNDPPVADAGPDPTIQTQETETLDGSNSTDPEGGGLNYSWSLAGIEIATGPTPTVGPFDKGTYTVTLTVTDSEGATDTDSLMLTVLNRSPVADAGPDFTVSFKKGRTTTVTLDGTASSDPDGSLVSYVWSQGGTVVGSGATLPVELAKGTHAFSLTVTDDDGAGASDDVVVTVTKGGGGGS